LIAVELAGVSRQFGSGAGVRELTLSVEEGERIAIVGPSGAGKSTIIRLIAGLEPIDSGTIRLRGEDVTTQPPSRRSLAVSLQGQPPYPHLSVFENLAFGLRARGLRSRELIKLVHQVAEALGLANLLTRRPGTLSGGERQRVVLGRSIATGASITLLDEPFAALDAPLRMAIRTDLAKLHDRKGGTWIIVTHDQSEAMALGHRVAVINKGQFVQIAKPNELFDHPTDRFVASFIGNPGVNLLQCMLQVGDNGLRLEGLIPGVTWQLPDQLAITRPLRARGPGPIELGFRPHWLRVPQDQTGAIGDLTVSATFERSEWSSPDQLAHGMLGNQSILFPMDAGLQIKPGDRIAIRLPLALALWFDPLNGGRRLLLP
jgi:multiple sugar transport system ATP-binding protein